MKSKPYRHKLLSIAYKHMHRIPRPLSPVYDSVAKFGSLLFAPAPTAHPTRTAKFICNANRFVYISVPKVANTSIQVALQNEFGKSGAGHCEVCNSDTISKLLDSGDWYCFSFVRNPWARVVSCYIDKFKEGNILGDLVFSRRRGLHPSMGFDEFVQWLATEEGADDVADPHWASQYMMLSHPRRGCICDFVGRLENIDQDWDYVSQRLKFSPTSTLPKLNSGRIGKLDNKNYRRWYTDRSAYIIQRRYDKDIREFGYQF